MIYATTTTPCYLTLVNVGSSGQARVLLPNVAQPQNLLPAGQTVVIPSAGVGSDDDPHWSDRGGDRHSDLHDRQPAGDFRRGLPMTATGFP